MQNTLNLNNCDINGLDDNFELDESNYQNFEFFRKNSCQNKGITILNEGCIPLPDWLNI